jgi:crotonobetaine/carnitine-CoA ligase
MAAVVPRPGQTVSPQALIQFLEPRMAHFMVTRYIAVVTELPKTPTGKVRKHVLREAGITPGTWDRSAPL